MQTITVNEFREKLAKLKGTQFVTIKTLTPVSDMRAKKDGKPNPFWKSGIMKRSVLNGAIGFDYENSVNRQLIREDKEAEFEAQERSWGSHVNSVLVEHNDKFYLSFKCERVISRQYELDGKIIEDCEVDQFRAEKKEGERQGTDKPTVYRNFLLSNILSIKMNGEEFIVVA